MNAAERKGAESEMVKRQCLICRMGDDRQRLEPLEVIAGSVQLIAPYWRGPEEAPIKVRPYAI